MKKNVSYPNVLKQAISEAISEFDASKTVDVSGPMLDPILKWDGQGEMPTNKDAASILERYYFNEKIDKGIELQTETEMNQDGTEGKTSAEGDAEGEGTKQAGTNKGNLDAAKKAIEKEISESESEKHAEGEGTEQAGTGNDKKILDAIKKEAKKIKDNKMLVKEPPVEDEEGDATDITEELENTVIEKLIAEMENEEDTEAEEDKEEDKEEDEDLDIDKEIKEAEDVVNNARDAVDADEDLEIEEAFKIFKEEIEEEEEEEEEDKEEEEEEDKKKDMKK